MYAPVRPHGEAELDRTTDLRVARPARIIRAPDLTGDLFEVSSPVSITSAVAKAITAPVSTEPTPAAAAAGDRLTDPVAFPARGDGMKNAKRSGSWDYGARYGAGYAPWGTGGG